MHETRSRFRIFYPISSYHQTFIFSLIPRFRPSIGQYTLIHVVRVDIHVFHLVYQSLVITLSSTLVHKTRVQTELFISYIKTESTLSIGFCCTHCNLIGSIPYLCQLSITTHEYLLTIGRINTQRRDTKNRIHRTSFHVLQERLSLQSSIRIIIHQIFLKHLLHSFIISTQALRNFLYPILIVSQIKVKDHRPIFRLASSHAYIKFIPLV